MREDVQAAYDEIAEAYAVASGDSTGPVPLLEELAYRLDNGARILDVGCGDGTPVLEYFKGLFEVVGMDISREQLRLAAKTVPSVPLYQGEMTQLSIGPSNLDAIVAFYSLIHVPREDHQAVFEEWARVLEPGGWSLFSSGTESWEGHNPDWLGTGVEMTWSYLDPANTIAALEEAGFVLETTQQVTDSLADEGHKQFFLARLPSNPQSINAGARN